MRKRCWVVIALALMAVVVAWSLYARPEAKPGRTASRSASKSSLPRVDGEIVKIRSSPDLMRIGLLVEKQVGENSRSHNAVIFDPYERRILVQTGLVGYLDDLAWSSDSRHLLVSYGGRAEVRLLSTDGACRRITLPDELSDVEWHPTEPGRFFYSTQYDVYEYSVESGGVRHVYTGGDVDGLFLVNGETCVADSGRRKQATGLPFQPKSSIRVSRLSDHKAMLKVPLYEYGYSDGFEFDMSPDGRFFSLSSSASGGSVNVIARVEDAETVMKREYEAIMCQNAIDDTLIPIWPDDYITRECGSEALIVADLDGFLLDLETGSRRYWYDYTVNRCAARLRPLSSRYFVPEFECMYAVVNNKGLGVRDFVDQGLDRTVLLLEHKRQNP